MRHHVLASVLFTLLASGCTTMLKTEQIPASNTKLPEGALYHLPKTVLDATLSFMPTQCYVKGNGEATIRYQITAAQIAQRFVPDPDEVYVLKYAALNSKMKITAANLTWHPSGMLKSLNADMEDRTAQVLSSAAGIAINLAKASAFPGGISPVGVSGENRDCPAPIKTRLAQIKVVRDELIDADTADKELDDQKTELAKAQTALDVAKAKLAASPQDAALLADFKAKETTVTRLAAALKDKKQKLPKAQAKWDALQKALTAKASGTWEPAKAHGKNSCTPVSLEFNTWTAQLIDADTTATDIEALNTMKFGGAKFEGWICLDMGTTAQVAPAAPPDGDIGLVYRLPRMAKVQVRATKEGDALQGTGDSWISVPQFGVKTSLPLKNGPFDKNTLKVAFAEDGSLSSLDFTAQSAAERGAAALQDLSKSYVDLVTERDKARKARIAAQDAETKKIYDDQIADYNAQIALINKRKELETARSGGKDRTQLEIEATDKETQLLSKKIELEKKRQELEKLTSTKP